MTYAKDGDRVVRFARDGNVKIGTIQGSHKDSGIGIMWTIMWDRGLWSPMHWDLRPDAREELWLWPT